MGAPSHQPDDISVALTVQIVDAKLGDLPRRGCTSGRCHARKVLDALGVAQLSPPQARKTI